jgi:hypothetical protein
LAGRYKWLAQDEGQWRGDQRRLGLNHRCTAYRDPDHGSNLWCLWLSRCGGGIDGDAGASDPELLPAGRGLSYRLCVLHGNDQQRLYAKLGFRRLRAFTIKRKNRHCFMANFAA